MKKRLPVVVGLLALGVASAALAGPREYLFQDARICDTQGVFCFRGTMSYRSNPRLLSLRARVQEAPGPGMLRIRLTGANELGHVRFAPFEVEVDGNNSEIINHEMIPDYPDVLSWQVDSVQFVASEDT